MNGSGGPFWATVLIASNIHFGAKVEVEQLCIENTIVTPKQYNYGLATTQLAAVGMSV